MTAEITIRHRQGGYPLLNGPGLLDEAGDRILKTCGQVKAAVITDENVARFHLERLEATLGKAGIPFDVLTLPPGEATKSMEKLGDVLNFLLNFRIARSDIVIAFGGGVIGDLAGLAASLVRRGCQLVIIPSTLLSQVDSSIGGKTAINMDQGKNLVGTFYPPRLVIADTLTLETLPERELRAGYAEMVKHAILEGEKAFAELEGTAEKFLEKKGEDLARAIARSCLVKARLVEEDERESGKRMLLNLGHTFAHALEGAAGYSGQLLHGEAVSIGLVMASQYAEKTGLANEKIAGRIENHLENVKLPANLKQAKLKTGAGQLMKFIHQDKKATGENIRLVLPRAFGDVVIREDVNSGELENFLKTFI